MLNYPITLEADSNGPTLVGFVDFPEANAVGENEAHAVAQALDALETAVELYFDLRRLVPRPSPTTSGQPFVALTALETAKVLVWNEMMRKKYGRPN